MGSRAWITVWETAIEMCFGFFVRIVNKRIIAIAITGQS
jgi:hypothetical protein